MIKRFIFILIGLLAVVPMMDAALRHGDEGPLNDIQTGLDCVENCRRRAMLDPMHVSPFGYGRAMRSQFDVADSFMAKMEDETYARREKAELSQTEEIQYDDRRINPRGFGLGMHCGNGGEFYTGSLANYLTPITGLDFGFDFCFGQVNLYLSGLFGWDGCLKQPIARNGYQWRAGKRLTGGNLEGSFGATVFDSQRWKVVPFAGIGVGFLDYPSLPGNPDKRTDEISGFRYQAGISADLKFLRVVDYVQALDGLSEFSVRSCLYVARTDFRSLAPSWTINFGISINMLTWVLK